VNHSVLKTVLQRGWLGRPLTGKSRRGQLEVLGVVRLWCLLYSDRQDIGQVHCYTVCVRLVLLRGTHQQVPVKLSLHSCDGGLCSW
jgi:uncharacterized RDD family membrane protein YckC